MKYWTRSWNCLYGCTKLRAGCTNCWALAMATRMQGNGLLDGVVDAKGAWTGKIVYKPERLDMPRHWKTPQIVAVDWMSDIFHKDVPFDVWPATLRVMSDTPQHTYLILTKRYWELLHRLYPQDATENIYIGVTISNQKDADEAGEALFWASTTGWKTWVSFEPALEMVNWHGFGFLDGMVCGGESGTGARPMPIEAAREARDYCINEYIPFTFKQFGPRGMGAELDAEHYQEFPNAL